jgi:hypothetical protein
VRILPWSPWAVTGDVCPLLALLLCVRCVVLLFFCEQMRVAWAEVDSKGNDFQQRAAVLREARTQKARAGSALSVHTVQTNSTSRTEGERRDAPMPTALAICDGAVTSPVGPGAGDEGARVVTSPIQSPRRVPGRTVQVRGAAKVSASPSGVGSVAERGGVLPAIRGGGEDARAVGVVSPNAGSVLPGPKQPPTSLPKLAAGAGPGSGGRGREAPGGSSATRSPSSSASPSDDSDQDSGRAGASRSGDGSVSPSGSSGRGSDADADAQPVPPHSARRTAFIASLRPRSGGSWTGGAKGLPADGVWTGTEGNGGAEPFAANHDAPESRDAVKPKYRTYRERIRGRQRRGPDDPTAPGPGSAAKVPPGAAVTSAVGVPGGAAGGAAGFGAAVTGTSSAGALVVRQQAAGPPSGPVGRAGRADDTLAGMQYRVRGKPIPQHSQSSSQLLQPTASSASKGVAPAQDAGAWVGVYAGGLVFGPTPWCGLVGS